MPSIRDGSPNNGAIRNEDTPDPCEVKRNKGHGESIVKNETGYALMAGLIVGLIILCVRSCHKDSTLSSINSPSFSSERNARCRLCSCTNWKFYEYGSCVYCGHSIAQH